MAEHAISKRRTVKPERMNGQRIEDDTIRHLLEMADWAPTHARTEPWRFVVYTPETINTFSEQHAALYKEHTPAERFKQASYDKLLTSTAGASHVLIVYMKRGSNPNIPEIEEVAATSAAIQNILISATELGIASFWSTGGMTHHDAFKDFLQINDEDKVLGLLFLGYPLEEPKEGKRNIPLSEKTRWMK